jgi:hypothetical protein
LIGEATKYNFKNLKKLTEEIIWSYNSQKPHKYLNNLPPDSWASIARELPNQTHVLSSESQPNVDVSVVDIPSIEVLTDNVEIIRKASLEDGYVDYTRGRNTEELLVDIADLNRYKMVPFLPLSRNDNSEEARKIREFHCNICNLRLIESVEGKKIDLSQFDESTKEKFAEIEKDTEVWKNTDIRFLETIVLQNQILLSNVEELKEELRRKTDELKLQNNQLLNMNHYLVEKLK